MNRKYKIAFLTLIFGAVLLLASLYLRGLDIAILNPKGMIALKERKLIIIITLLMLIVVIPTFFLTVFFAWKYREGNTKATYTPDWDRNRIAESIWWGIPCLIIAIIAVIGWKSCHELDPFKPLAINTKPIRIQVIALQWKWLFIYPDQNIATVNFIQFPENTPLDFEITADAPMNSFWIPQLGGQIYAMPGMKSKLHLIAGETGSFRGSSANLSGKGFSDMTFVAKSSSQVDFDNWVLSIKQSFSSLDLDEYNNLSKPSVQPAATYYLLEEKNLYDEVVKKYMGSDARLN